MHALPPLRLAGYARTRVMVYGTLLSGEPNHRVLEGARFIARAQTPPSFRMYDLGGCPAVTTGGDTIHGEVYDVDERTLARLDRLEVHPTLYRRTRIHLADGSRAEIYLLASMGRIEGRPVIASGDWRARGKCGP